MSDTSIDTTGTTDSGSTPTSEAPLAPGEAATKPTRKPKRKVSAKAKKITSKKAKKIPSTKRQSAASKSKKSGKAPKYTGVRKGFQALPFLFPYATVTALDRARVRIGLPSRIDLFRRAVAAYLTSKGERKAASYFQEPREGKAKGKK